MDLVAITLLFTILSALVTPCLSLQLQASSEAQQVFVSGMLHRKVRLFEEVKVNGHGGQDSSVSNNEQRDKNISGKEYEKKEKVVHGSKGTRQEWVERSDKWEYYSMDYTHVRRRRPIHNKSLRKCGKCPCIMADIVE